jgi:hypothetical protein
MTTAAVMEFHQIPENLRFRRSFAVSRTTGGKRVDMTTSG